MKSGGRFRRLGLHAVRVALFAAVILLIRTQHLRRQKSLSTEAIALSTEDVQLIWPDAAAIDHDQETRFGVAVLDGSGSVLGAALQSSPEADHILGFSGPTNVLVGLDADHAISEVEILWSKDTAEHLAQIRLDKSFLRSFSGISVDNMAAVGQIDVVSGATLTCRAIQGSVLLSLSGSQVSLKFQEPIQLKDARVIFPEATAVSVDERFTSLWNVKGQGGNRIGTILRTSPAADNIIGYQGPTDTLIGFGPDDKIIGLAVGQSYDNEPYVDYVRDDTWFPKVFRDLTLQQLAELDPFEAQVEGVSGATMTSLAVTDGMIQAAIEHQKAIAVVTAAPPPKPALPWTVRDAGTAVVIVVALLIAFTKLRGRKEVRIAFQCVLIGYLGLMNGDMVSQAMLVGWAKSGVPFQNAGGLVLLTMAAFAVPVFTKQNVYCSHICPHGAVQQLLRNRLPWRWKLSSRVAAGLKVLPAILLTWCVVVAMGDLPFSLVGIEPFDAWVFQIAGWATISVAIVGLVMSLFVPMAYCRYGCPTGALLGHLRFNENSGRWTSRDWLSLLLVAGAALALCF